MPYGPDRRGGAAIVPCRYEIVLKERNPKLVVVGKYLHENDCTEELISEDFSNSCPLYMYYCVRS